MMRKVGFDRLVNEQLEAIKPRAKSLLVTVYGDAIAPHGGSVWLGSLIKLMAPLGLSERMVRTAVFRLIKDDWLAATPIGRRSSYGISEAGRGRFEAASRRIHAPLSRPWDGEWHMVILAGNGALAEQREALKRELGWQGFGYVGPNLLVHPSADPPALHATIEELGLAESIVVMKGRDDRKLAAASLKSLIRSGWDIDKLGADYDVFTKRFRPVAARLAETPPPTPEQAFLIRILMMHDFRRVLLRDPMLPEALLPKDWAGSAARRLCRDIYRLVQAPSEAHLMTSLETASGPLPPADPGFYGRFGGFG
jgi:phenylacetic acid degradation operon negative regulatory protein